MNRRNIRAGIDFSIFRATSLPEKAISISARCIYHAAASFLCLILCLTSITAASASSGVEAAGDVLQIVLPAAAVGMAGYYRDGKGALQFVESAALTTVVTYGLKYSIEESRPNGGGHSFPSGHTSMSFAAAEFMRKRYGWEYGIPAYVAASFVGYSRVEARQHYLHDVMVGAGIGIVSSYFFTKPYKDWYVQPEADGRYYGIRLSRTW